MRRLIKIFLVWRILLFLPLYIGELFVNYRPGFQYTNIWKFAEPYFPVSSFFLYPWANFDGVHYLRIAGEGYTNNLQFFPVYPLLIKLVSFIIGTGDVFGGRQFFSALLISNLALLISLYLFFKLLRLDYSEKISFQAIIFLLLFPTSFFLGSIYSESILLLFALLSLYFARQKNFLLAGIFGMAASATRIVGIAIFPALLWELYTHGKSEQNKTIWLRVFYIFLSPIGLVLYAIYNQIQTGNLLYFVNAHGKLFNGRSTDSIVLWPQTFFRYIKILSTLPINNVEWWIALLEISAFIFAVILLFLAIKRSVRTSYVIFGTIAFLIPALSGTFSGLPRYILMAFPIFIALSLTENKFIRIGYILITPLVLFLLLILFSRGYYIA